MTQATQFDRDAMAAWYAGEHLKTDPGITAVYYLPTGAGEREIRFIEVNVLGAERTDAILEPLDFGTTDDHGNRHQLQIMDVTPNQWERMLNGELALPNQWSLDGVIRLGDE